MLRRLKIGGRLNVLIALPLLALAAMAVVGTYVLTQGSVKGDEYKRLKLAQDLRAEVIPPPASLLEAWAQVNHIGVLAASPDGFSDDTLAEIESHFDIIERAQTDFGTSMAYWSKQAVPMRVGIRLIEIGGFVGVKFFEDVNFKLRQAIDSRDADEVLAVIRDMEWRYDLQQTGVQRAVDFAVPEVIAREKTTVDYLNQAIVVAGAVFLILLVLTVLLAILVRRSIVRPIRRLAEQAKSVATNDLPEAVRVMQDDSAAEVPHLQAFEISSRDELAELSASFNAVQDVAVDLAAEQAIARRVVSQNLVNIARRNQNLLGRTLGFISSLEQGERDPEALDNLFRLDHLTTRMRRNAQSLLVLAGAEPTRLWSPAVAIGDVVRAALSEVENYGQVELADLGDIGVIGSAAGEVAHLLAELLENATSFSPPTSAVTVVGRAVPDGHQLAIFDYGLGMTPEELDEANRRLNQVSAFDRESNKMLGFQVVARLADRYGIKVMLTTTPGGSGVTAIVRLPKSLLEVVGTLGTNVPPVADVPRVAERLTEPLPVTPAGVGVPGPMLHELSTSAPSQMSDEALWAEMNRTSARADAPDLGQVPPMAPLSFAPLSAHPATDGPTMVALPVALPAEPAPALAPLITDAGLTRRVRGAQMPELGKSAGDAPQARPAEEVRNTLASLQRGIDLGRQRNNEG
ncbi:MAG: HAMP domain-containing protein [Actinomycetota bacterium]|nr:HAMP domain-containing protein [Actinomycetota bacterium]